LAVAVLAAFGFSHKALAVPQQDVLLSGQTTIASIDADQDGTIEEPEDCNLSAKSEPNGANLTIMGTQMPGPNQLKACSGNCWGSTDVFSDFAEVMIQSCTYSSPPFVPLLADFCSTSSSCSANPTASATGGRAAGAGPLQIVAGEIFQTSQGFRSGFGRLCNAGGAAVQITDEGGNTVLRSLDPYPNAQNPTHLCVQDVPVQLLSGQFVLRTACFPIRNGGADFALSGNPSNAIVVMTFADLAGCSTGAAPTMSQWGLIMLLLALLVVGVWAVGRRPGFYGSLSLSLW
jgi:hypothetical protein